MTIEHRTVRGVAPEVGANGLMTGRAIPFNSVTTIGRAPWGFREKVDPGACNKSIKDGDVVLLDQHDTSKPLARMSAGTLRMKAGKTHAEFDADEPNTSYGHDAAENVRNGNYGGMSFGFEVVRDSWEPGENGEMDTRTIHEMKLHEISFVTFPAYSNTSASMRDAANAARETMPDEMRADAPKPYGDVKYADPKNGKYPIDTAAHVKAALSYIAVAKNAAKYPLNGVTLASVVAKIKAAAKKFGIGQQDNAADLDAELRDEYDDEFYESEDAVPEGEDGVDRSAPYDEQAAELITLYNELPADQRAAVLAAITAEDSAPDSSTRENEARKMEDALRAARLRALSR